MTVEGRPGQLYEVRAYTPLRLEVIGGVRSIEVHGDCKSLKLSSPQATYEVDRAGYTSWQVRVKAER